MLEDVNIALALRNHCLERHKPIEIWGDKIDGSWDNDYSGHYRLVFRIVKGRNPNSEERSDIYVDVSFNGTTNVTLQNEARESVVIDLMSPDSIDILDEFIGKRSGQNEKECCEPQSNLRFANRKR